MLFGKRDPGPTWQERARQAVEADRWRAAEEARRFREQESRALRRLLKRVAGIVAEPAGDTITVDGVTFRVRWNPARKRYDLYVIRDSLDTRIESTLDLGYALERPGSPG